MAQKAVCQGVATRVRLAAALNQVATEASALGAWQAVELLEGQLDVNVAGRWRHGHLDVHCTWAQVTVSKSEPGSNVFPEGAPRRSVVVVRKTAAPHRTRLKRGRLKQDDKNRTTHVFVQQKNATDEHVGASSTIGCQRAIRNNQTC